MFGDKNKELKKVIIENCELKSIPVKVEMKNKKGKTGTITKRKWEVTDINLEPIIEAFEKHLKPKKEKSNKKIDGGE